MFKGAVENKQFWYWPALLLALLLLIALVQISRVNRPHPEPVIREPYTAKGVLVHEDIKIAADDFHATRINLNRRAKLSGTFRTENVKSHVSVLVVDESNFNKWKLEHDYSAVIQTGYVPGGKIAPVLEPGAYFLVIDNRRSDAPRSVRAEFNLD